MFSRSSIRKLIVITYPIYLLICLYGVTSANAEEIRVGYVDMQRAIDESRVGRQAKKEFEEEYGKTKTVLEQKKQEFENLKGAFAKQHDSLNEQARREKQEKLISMEKDLKRSFQDSEDMLRRKNSALLSELVKQLRDVVADYGREQGFTLILEKGAAPVLFADNRIDVTGDVVKLFDQSGAKRAKNP